MSATLRPLGSTTHAQSCLHLRMLNQKIHSCLQFCCVSSSTSTFVMSTDPPVSTFIMSADPPLAQLSPLLSCQLIHLSQSPCLSRFTSCSPACPCQQIHFSQLDDFCHVRKSNFCRVSRSTSCSPVSTFVVSVDPPLAVLSPL